ncbi:hypothetical protein CERZMDRAFT_97836 [Cercospora zeae-maydis SCOH1-5]|uniref:Uncharacterized protein n=1 Tax=Cercospora zeae-maydis SCOH1-5 TaxID=717836 RepID=A0A6A6FEU3_9PEZI|nr:hypothetical protein CERZMDRAFT_97836 [Cercospora zeae-maydis SCOH1-5]
MWATLCSDHGPRQPRSTPTQYGIRMVWRKAQSPAAPESWRRDMERVIERLGWLHYFHLTCVEASPTAPAQGDMLTETCPFLGRNGTHGILRPESMASAQDVVVTGHAATSARTRIG